MRKVLPPVASFVCGAYLLDQALWVPDKGMPGLGMLMGCKCEIGAKLFSTVESETLLCVPTNR